MTINRTTLLDLPLPVTGTESGTWGDIVNNGLSEYIDISVAGSLSLSADSDTNLSSTEGNAAGTNIGSTTAQYAILRCTGARTATRNINAPAWAISGGTLTNYSKIYIVVNETTGSQNIVLRATDSATPTYTTGVTIVPGERAVCAWNGSDFVKVGGAAGGSTTQIQFNNAGVFGGSANLTWDGTNVQIGATGALRLADTDSSNYVAFKSPGTVASNVTWTLPSADGTNGQALTTNGSGTLAFSSVTTAPGGSTTQVQYNNAGAFGGSANFVWDDSNVRLGIGTSSPQTLLQISSVTPLLSLRESDGAADEKSFDLRVNSKEFSIRSVNDAYNAANNVIAATRSTGIDIDNVRFFTGAGTERMRITSAGNVGIGESSPATLLDVKGNGVPLTINSANSNGNKVQFEDNGTVKSYLGTTSFSGVVDCVFQASDSSGNIRFSVVAASGTIGLNTQPTTSGTGITFPATQSASSDANTLDDYEEGTWTPTIVGSSTAGTATYSTQLGKYTKTGNVVTYQCIVEWSSGTGTGFLRVSGLPFNDAGGSNLCVASILPINVTLPASSIAVAFPASAQSYITISSYPAGGGADSAVSYDAAGSLYIAGSYFA